MAETAALLDVRGLHVSYGAADVLAGLDLALPGGDILGIVGPNGAGKSTLIRTIIGLVRPRAGEIRVAGRDLTGCSPERVHRAGVGYVPEGRRVFGALTVEENLIVGGHTVARGERRARVKDLYELFPVLGSKRRAHASSLSGGEQQMLAIGRALAASPKVVLLDEPTLGLAPVIVEQLCRHVAQIAATGVAVLVAEQNLRACARIANQLVRLTGGVTVALDAGASHSVDDLLLTTDGAPADAKKR